MRRGEFQSSLFMIHRNGKIIKIHELFCILSSCSVSLFGSDSYSDEHTQASAVVIHFSATRYHNKHHKCELINCVMHKLWISLCNMHTNWRLRSHTLIHTHIHTHMRTTRVVCVDSHTESNATTCALNLWYPATLLQICRPVYDIACRTK